MHSIEKFRVMILMRRYNYEYKDEEVETDDFLLVYFIILKVYVTFFDIEFLSNSLLIFR